MDNPVTQELEGTEKPTASLHINTHTHVFQESLVKSYKPHNESQLRSKNQMNSYPNVQ